MELDVFVMLPKRGPLLTLTEIYNYADIKGWASVQEYIGIGGWKVQFLNASTPLEEEALREAVSKVALGVPTRVLSMDHLIAIAANVGREKDIDRIGRFFSQADPPPDPLRVAEICTRHGLLEKWTKIAYSYL